jgi:hypothetical protein
MPLFLQYIGFIISIFGFFITILTFIAASRVNKKIKSLNELKDFHVHKTEILNQLEGFVRSINSDQLQESDTECTLYNGITQSLTDIESRYTNLSWKTQKALTSLQKYLKRDNFKWSEIALKLITLKNNIDKEI